MEFITKEDKPGIIRDLSNLLADWKVNLRKTESNILVWNDIGKWEVFADISNSPFTHSEIRKKLLQNEKIKEQIDEVRIERLQVTRKETILGVIASALRPWKWSVRIWKSFGLVAVCLLGTFVVFQFEIPEKRNLIEFIRLFGVMGAVISSLVYLFTKIAEEERGR